MHPALTFLRRPPGLMRRYMITMMVKINPAITLLSKLCNSRVSRIPSYPCSLIEMLNIDEGIVLVDNKLKIL